MRFLSPFCVVMLVLLGSLSLASLSTTATAQGLGCLGMDASANRRFEQAIFRFAGFESGFRIKQSTGMYSMANAFARRELAPPTEAIQATLSMSPGTGLLVFDTEAGRRGCVFLVGPQGLIASQGYILPDSLNARLRMELAVSGRARAPVRRGLQPAEPQPQLAGGMSPGRANAFLAEIAAALLPDTIVTQMRPFRRIAILAGGEMSTMPFAALPLAAKDEPLVAPLLLTTPDEPLGVRHALIMVANVSDLGDPLSLAPARREFRSVTVYGDPDLSTDPQWRFPPLPGARAEAGLVQEAFAGRTQLRLGGLADRSSVVGAAQRSDLLYFATHAMSDSINPMDGSFIALQGGRLYGREISGLGPLSQRPLIVLSACQTGLGKAFDGGVYGPARAWLKAGAGQVVASLWNVDDQATASLMSRFVKKLADGAAPEIALQQAVRKMWKEHPDDPAKWSAFYLLGAPTLGAV